MPPAGGILVTGHDPDFHAAQGNLEGARNIIQRAVEYVTFTPPHTFDTPPFPTPPPKILLVTSVQPPPPGHRDPRVGLTDAGFSFEVADAGSGTPGVLDLATVNFSDFDLVVVASDHGGLLTQAELDILNARSAELIEYVNNGGGLVAFAESGQEGELTTHDRFGYLPFLVSEVPLGQNETGFTLTAEGHAIGLREADINGNVSHDVFTETGGMDAIDLDAQQRIVTVAKRGARIGGTGVATLMWVNHLALLPGDKSVETSFDAVTSGVGGGLSGLVIQSNTSGEEAKGGGNKVVWTALEVPPEFTIEGVRLCYELSDQRSFISQIRLAQVQDPPSSAVVLHDDPTDLTAPGPICVNSPTSSIDPSAGPLLLSLRVNFGKTTDRIVVRGLGLHLLPKG